VGNSGVSNPAPTAVYGRKLGSGGSSKNQRWISIRGLAGNLAGGAFKWGVSAVGSVSFEEGGHEEGGAVGNSLAKNRSWGQAVMLGNNLDGYETGALDVKVKKKKGEAIWRGAGFCFAMLERFF